MKADHIATIEKFISDFQSADLGFDEIEKKEHLLDILAHTLFHLDAKDQVKLLENYDLSDIALKRGMYPNNQVLDSIIANDLSWWESLPNDSERAKGVRRWKINRQNSEEYGIKFKGERRVTEGVTKERSRRMSEEESKLDKSSLTPIFEGGLNREAMATALKNAMSDKKLSVRKAAEAAGVSASVISMIKDQYASLDKSAEVLSELGYKIDFIVTPKDHS